MLSSYVDTSRRVRLVNGISAFASGSLVFHSLFFPLKYSPVRNSHPRAVLDGLPIQKLCHSPWRIFHRSPQGLQAIQPGFPQRSAGTGAALTESPAGEGPGSSRKLPSFPSPFFPTKEPQGIPNNKAPSMLHDPSQPTPFMYTFALFSL